MFVPKFYGDVDGQKLDIHDKDRFREYLAGIQGKVELLVYPWKAKRTFKQNSYYWAYLKMVSEETGFTDEELHELFKQKFLDKRKIQVMGEEIEVHPSTTRLTRKEMADYITNIETFTGIQAPDSKQVAII